VTGAGIAINPAQFDREFRSANYSTLSPPRSVTFVRALVDFILEWYNRMPNGASLTFKLEDNMTASASEVAHAWFARAWNAGEESAIDELFSPNVIAHGLSAEPMRGPEAFKPFFRAFRSAIPDITVTVLKTVTEGNLCATFCEVEGTHTGDQLGFAATNRRVKFSGFTLTRVEDGKIHEGWNTYDFLSMYQQLGVIPASLT